MDAKTKHNWIGALRSGQFKQGRYNLAVKIAKDKCEFCVLGVLAEVKQVPRESNSCYGACDYVFGPKSRRDDMPSATFLKKVGLRYGIAERLMTMNDNGKDFEELASYIEENL